MQDHSHRLQYVTKSKPGDGQINPARSIPLVDLCRNNWRSDDSEPRHPQRASLDPLNRYRPSLREIGFKQWTRWGVVILTMLLFTLLVKVGVTMMGEQDSDTTVISFDTSSKHPQAVGETFGHNQSPPLEGVTKVTKLDVMQLLGTSQLASNGQSRRLIFIGDIHGCYEELLKLLDKAEYNEETDHIIAVGDLVNKGPESGRVLDFLASKRASCVRGNHDDRILLKAAQKIEAQDEQTALADPEMKIAKSLTDSQRRYLQSCPLILNLGEVPIHGNIIVVHGGLVPSVDLENQDPWAVMNMRVIHPSTHIPSGESSREDYIPWAELWNQEQERRATGQSVPQDGVKQMLDTYASTTVIYGHDARSGLRIHRFTKGIDSGCVRGKKLTALILSEKPEEELVQVQCKKYA